MKLHLSNAVNDCDRNLHSSFLSRTRLHSSKSFSNDQSEKERTEIKNCSDEDVVDVPFRKTVGRPFYLDQFSN